MASDQKTNPTETTSNEPTHIDRGSDAYKRIEEGVKKAFAPMLEICDGEGRFAGYSPKERFKQLGVASKLTQGEVFETLFPETKA